MQGPFPNKKCSHAGFWIAISLLGAFLFFSGLVNVSLFIALAAKAGVSVVKGEGEDEFPKFTERWSYGSGDLKAVRIGIQWPIFRDSEPNFWGVRYDRVESTLRQIRAAMNDEDVLAILLEVDSPGGDITSCEEIVAALEDFKASADDRIVVAMVRDLAASGGYMVSLPADWIIAEPTATLGSIGVILQTLNWKALSEKIGITDVTIKSVENKDLLNPFRDVSSNQLVQLQGLVDEMHQRFVTQVQEARGVDAEALKTLADGRIFSAEIALKNKLIDQIGTWNDALDKLSELLGEESVRIVRYEHKPQFLELLSEIRAPPLSYSRLVEYSTPRLMYLWRP